MPMLALVKNSCSPAWNGAEAGQQLVGDGAGVAGLVQAGQQDDEFVAAQAGHGVDVAHLLLQALGDAFEQQVADRVAEAVVDVLEAVEVEEQHRALAVGDLRAGEHGLQAASRTACGWAGRSAGRGGPGSRVWPGRA
jgi:hypothetical protein